MLYLQDKLNMDILKGVGSNSCIEFVEEGGMYALLCLKSDGLEEFKNIKYNNRCGITDGIGAEYMLYLQDKLLWPY